MDTLPDSWMSPSQRKATPDMMKEYIDEHMDEEIELVNVNYSDDVLIKLASGGLALQGVLISRSLDDQLQTRDHLLQISENAKLAGPTISHVEEYEYFSSKAMEDKHKLIMNTFGCSITTAMKFPVYAGAAVAEASASVSLSNESIQMHKTLKETTYSSTVKRCLIPVKSYSFQMRDIMFSSNAMMDLQEIQTLLIEHGMTNQNVQQKCEQFFNTYGSHVCRGPMHFGGIYWWTCSSEGFCDDELSYIRELQNEA